VRAVLEGVAFNLRTCLAAFAENDVPITQLDVIGGGASSNVWGIPVRRRSIIEEANSLGAAVTGMVGVGLADFSLARTLSTVTAEFEPDPSLSAEYAERHRVFVDAYERLEPWFETRHRSSVSQTHADKGES
jgi:xylulokinase